MRFVYLFKIYSNRIVKVKSAFLRKDRDAAIDISAPALLLHRGVVTPNCVIADASEQYVHAFVTACRPDLISAAGPLFS